MTKNIVSSLVSALPAGLWHSLCRSPLILPYYHMVSDESLPHVSPIYSYRTIGQFTADLDFFLEHFQPIGLPDLLGHLHGEKSLPARSFLLTFDDGFREMAEIVAPILKAKGVPAVFFINSAFVDNRELCLHQKIALLIDRVTTNPPAELEPRLKAWLQSKGVPGNETIAALRSIRYARRSILDEAAAICSLDFPAFLARQKPYLTSDQIHGLLRDGFAIGGHSVDHPLYRDLTLTEQLNQTRQSLDFLQAEFGINNRSFAFPHSDAGVSQAFFDRAYGDGTLEISFGTSGLLRDSQAGHFQRFSMEKTGEDPRRILAWQLARRRCRPAIRHPANPNRTEADFHPKKAPSA